LFKAPRGFLFKLLESLSERIKGAIDLKVLVEQEFHLLFERRILTGRNDDPSARRDGYR